MLSQKILIIDDDPDVAQKLQTRMESFGFECYVYTTIKSALRGVKAIKPDLIAIDLGYAQTEGIGFVTHVHDCLEPGDNVPPVIVINGDHDHVIRDYAMDLGAHALLVNPFMSMGMSSIIDDYLPMDSEMS